MASGNCTACLKVVEREEYEIKHLCAKLESFGQITLFCDGIILGVFLQNSMPNVLVHVYFSSVLGEPQVMAARRRHLCFCCSVM